MKTVLIIGLVLLGCSAFSSEAANCERQAIKWMTKVIKVTSDAPLFVDNIKVGASTSKGIVTVVYTANLADLTSKKIKTVAGSVRFLEKECQPEQESFTAGIEVK